MTRLPAIRRSLILLCLLSFIAACGPSVPSGDQQPQEDTQVAIDGKIAAANTTFKLRLIVYGLNAIVPGEIDGQGNVGEISILPIEAPDHTTRLAMLQGVCKSGAAVCKPAPSQFDLDWNLSNGFGFHDYMLSFGSNISSGPTVSIGLKKPAIAPTMVPGARPWDWKWAGWLAHGQPTQPLLADKNCRDAPWNCNAATTYLKLNKADSFEVCHVAHKGVCPDGGQECEPKEDRISKFNFDNQTDPATARAIADAFVAEIRISGTGIDLVATDEWSNQVTARLEPSSGNVTLILSNNDYKNGPSGNPHHYHFKHYYQLTPAIKSNPSDVRYLKWVEDLGTAGDPGSCEDEIVDFERKLNATNGAHNQRECDSAVVTGWEI